MIYHLNPFLSTSWRTELYFIFSTGWLHKIQHRKWKETKQQSSKARHLAVLGCCSVSFHFRCWICLLTLYSHTCPGSGHPRLHTATSKMTKGLLSWTELKTRSRIFEGTSHGRNLKILSRLTWKSKKRTRRCCSPKATFHMWKSPWHSTGPTPASAALSLLARLWKI